MKKKNLLALAPFDEKKEYKGHALNKTIVSWKATIFFIISCIQEREKQLKLN